MRVDKWWQVEFKCPENKLQRHVFFDEENARKHKEDKDGAKLYLVTTTTEREELSDG